MFFPVRKHKKKSQSNKCKILKYFRTSGSTQEYLSTQTCQVQNTQEYLSTQKCQVQNTQEYLSTQTSKYPNTHQYLLLKNTCDKILYYLLTWNISLSNRVCYSTSEGSQLATFEGTFVLSKVRKYFRRYVYFRTKVRKYLRSYFRTFVLSKVLSYQLARAACTACTVYT